MSTAATVHIIPEGVCYRVRVVSKGLRCSRSYSTVRAAASDAATSGLIGAKTANALILRGIQESHGWSYMAVKVDPNELAAHHFVCS